MERERDMVKMNSSVRGNSAASIKYDLQLAAPHQSYTQCPVPYTTNHGHA
jgi:hypothetical protein